MFDLNSRIFQYLRAFYYVAQTRSIRNAANMLCLTPSAVSQQIQKLEEELDMPLFERKQGQPLQLLPAGRLLLKRIPPLEDMLFQLRSELEALHGKRVPLRVGTLPLLEPIVLRSVAAHTEDFPETAYTLHTRDGFSLSHSLLANELDCAFFFQEHLPSGVQSQTLMTIPMVLLTNEQTASSLSFHLAPEQLAHLPVIYFSGGSREPESDLYALAGLTGPIAVRTDTHASAVECVRLGLGTALVNELCLPEDMSGLCSYRLDRPMLRRHIVLTFPPALEQTPLFRRFLDIMEEQCSELMLDMEDKRNFPCCGRRP